MDSGCRLVLSGHKHVPYAWRLEDLFLVNAGTVSTLRLRGKGRPCYNIVEIDDERVRVVRKYPFHEREPIIEFSTRTLEHERWPGQIALIDGEHAPAVVRDALAALAPDGVVAALLLGSREKLREPPDAGDVRRAAPRARVRATAPTTWRGWCAETRRRRTCSTCPTSRWSTDAAASRWPPRRWPPAPATGRAACCWSRRASRRSPLPALAVAGTGKRVGKTAVAGHVARLAAAELGAGRGRGRGHGAGRAGASPSSSTPSPTPLGLARAAGAQPGAAPTRPPTSWRTRC